MTRLGPRFGIAVALVFGATALARASAAQEPTAALPQRLQPFGSIPPLASHPVSGPGGFPLALGEPSGDSGVLPGYFASAPLRLSLQNQIFPYAGGYDGCATRGDAAGNSAGGIPTQRYTLLRLTPNLVLHGFSAAGCPIDGATGAGLTYSVPVGPSLWLVAGAGVYSAPSLPGRRGARSDFRIDLVKKVDDMHSLSVGIGKRGVTFGGAF